MKLIILGAKYSKNSHRYKGIHRETPNPIEDLHGDGSIFWELVEREDNNFNLDDLDFAKKVVRAYRSLCPPQKFEVVEIVYDNELPETDYLEFLGFDVAQGPHTSALSFNLNFAFMESSPDFDRRLMPLYYVAEKYFYPLLNAHGLFDRYEDAQFFLEVLKSLRVLCPGFIEMEPPEFRVMGLWLVFDGDN